ncbi:hypothetical protein [Streptomyces sp. NPDC048349]|uniref:hypothetical protein n=1 Tax=Streptomyces sp. NPDC048349 TaxID=3155486 RepID=UPI00342EECE5
MSINSARFAWGATRAHQQVRFADLTADSHADDLLQQADGGTGVYGFNGGGSDPAGWTQLGASLERPA